MILWALASAAFGFSDCDALAKSAPLVGSAGERKIALLVGVGDYLAKPGGKSIDLVGPPNDAKRIRQLLLEQYGFPEDNVCMLLDKGATRENYLRAWREHLHRAKAGDTVVYFFAGHGSQVKDQTGSTDETDGMDETILLHDSRAPKGTPDILDDEFNQLLSELHKRTKNVTVLVDACNSGTTTRGVPGEDTPDDDARERRVEAVERLAPSGDFEIASPADYQPDALDGFVVVTAAQDGTSALERNGQGIFTDALIRSIQARPDGSWEQLTQSIPKWIAAQRSFQVATFEGQLDRKVFGTSVVQRELSWTVTNVSRNKVDFKGPAMPGWNKDAVVRVFEDDAKKPKARVRLSQASALSASGTLIGNVKDPIREGDFAVLESPGTESTSVRVQINKNVPLAKQIEKQIEGDRILSRTVQLVDNGAADFYVRPGPQGTVDIWGSEGVRRNRLAGNNNDDALNVAYQIGLHARQTSLIALSGEANDVYPQPMLEVKISRIEGRSGCERTKYETPKRAQPYVEVPMCNPVQVDVELIRKPRRKLYLGALFLANNGSILAWPRAGRTEVLENVGDKWTQQLGYLTPPLNTPDRILVFGTHDQVAWSKLAAPALKDVKTRGGGFSEFIKDHVGGTRGIDDEVPAGGADAAFTAAFVQVMAVGDETKWTQQERETSSICTDLRKAGCK